MTNLSIKKQILLILYSVLSIIFSMLFSTTYDSFMFLIPIALTNMFVFYFICRVKNNLNWYGLIAYFLSVIASFTIMVNVEPNPLINDVRAICVNYLSFMFIIIGVLGGGILRYKMERAGLIINNQEGDENEEEQEIESKHD